MMLIILSSISFMISIYLSLKVIPNEKDKSKSKKETVFWNIFFWIGVSLSIISIYFKDEKPQVSFMK